VFCRETGAKDEEDEVDALEGVGSIIATDMLPGQRKAGLRALKRSSLCWKNEGAVTPGCGRTKNFVQPCFRPAKGGPLRQIRGLAGEAVAGAKDCIRYPVPNGGGGQSGRVERGSDGVLAEVEGSNAKVDSIATTRIGFSSSGRAQPSQFL
jgi:hypothetical protein